MGALTDILHGFEEIAGVLSHIRVKSHIDDDVARRNFKDVCTFKNTKTTA